MRLVTAATLSSAAAEEFLFLCSSQSVTWERLLLGAQTSHSWSDLIWSGQQRGFLSRLLWWKGCFPPLSRLLFALSHIFRVCGISSNYHKTGTSQILNRTWRWRSCAQSGILYAIVTLQYMILQVHKACTHHQVLVFDFSHTGNHFVVVLLASSAEGFKCLMLVFFSLCLTRQIILRLRASFLGDLQKIGSCKFKKTVTNYKLTNFSQIKNCLVK